MTLKEAHDAILAIDVPGTWNIEVTIWSRELFTTGKREPEVEFSCWVAYHNRHYTGKSLKEVVQKVREAICIRKEAAAKPGDLHTVLDDILELG